MSRATLGRRRERPLTDTELTMAWQSASLLLDYPGPELPAHLCVVLELPLIHI